MSMYYLRPNFHQKQKTQTQKQKLSKHQTPEKKKQQTKHTFDWNPVLINSVVFLFFLGGGGGGGWWCTLLKGSFCFGFWN